MNAGQINFDEIKKGSAELLASADEAESGVKKLDGLMVGLCEKNDAPALKRQVDGLLETVTGFIKAVRSEMESVQDMVAKAENLQSSMG